MDTRVKRLIAIGLMLCASLAQAQTFNLFKPAAGILKGSTTTYVTTAAANSDVISLWSGTCNSTTFLRADGSCQPAGGGGGGSVTSVALTMPTGFTVTGSPITTTGTLAITTSLSGVLKGSAGAFTTAAYGDITGLWTAGGTCNSGTYLRGDGQCQAPAGAGTVTSVALTTPAWLTVGGSPITASGTLAVTATGGQTANQFLATPNGTTGAVGLRSIVAADLPAVSLTSGVGGILPVANGGTGTSTPGLVAGTNVTISGTWPNQTINSSGGAGGVTSVAMTVPGGFSVTGSPITGSGTLALTTALSGVIKGTGSAFTTAASSDIRGLWTGTCSSATYLRGDGTCLAPPGTTVGANPSVNAGLTAVNGSATTFMRSDAAPAIDQTIAPTWTGNHAFSAGVTVGAVANEGAGTLNATGLYINGVALSTTTATGANPTATVALTATNGSATTFMRSDAAPAINQAIAPTWTGLHVFQPSTSGAGQVPISVYPGSSTPGIYVLGSASTGVSYGVDIQAGTNSSDRAFQALTRTGTIGVRVYGDGGTIVGNPTGGDLGVGTLNVQNGLYVGGVAVATGGTVAETSGTFTPTWTGFGTAPTGVTMAWTKTGSTVTLYTQCSSCVAFTGASNANTFTISNIPSAIQPAHQQVGNNIVGYANAPAAAGTWVLSGATLSFGKDLTGTLNTWNTSSTKGLNAFTITYTVL